MNTNTNTNATPEFKTGDVVELRSGGHKMTVYNVGVEKSGDVGVYWSYCGGLHYRLLSSKLLVLVLPRKEPERDEVSEGIDALYEGADYHIMNAVEWGMTREEAKQVAFSLAYGMHASSPQDALRQIKEVQAALEVEGKSSR
jgi:uncharacterized protein YodC (DUF2158 family)